MDGSTVWLDIDQVASLEQNPKEHDIGAIIASMQRWGYIDVIGWNKRTGRVLDGNGRLEALRKMKAAGMAAPARVVVEGNTWKVETGGDGTLASGHLPGQGKARSVTTQGEAQRLPQGVKYRLRG